MVKRIKLIIFPGNFLPHVGGLETHVDEFAKYLSKDRKYDITIFAPKIVGGKTIEKIHTNVKVIRYPAFDLVPNFPFPKFWLPKFWKLLIGAYKRDYDLVMTRTRFFSNSFLGLIFAKFRISRIKLIHVEHGSSFVHLESKLKTNFAYVFDMIFGKMIFVFADRTIVISDAVNKFVRHNFVKSSKVDLPLIRRGVDFEIYDGIGIDRKLKSQFKGKVIMSFVGRLFKWKGVANTINAYKTLPKGLREKSVLIIVGDGEDFDRLKNLCGRYLNNGIYMFGKLEFRDAISILKTTDIYVHSAFPGGGLSNSLLQAMRCGCSIVASPNEGAKEVINRENGFLLRDNRVESLRLGMVKLLNNRDIREKYSKKARLDVERDFNWNDVVKKYDKVFSEVLGK